MGEANYVCGLLPAEFEVVLAAGGHKAYRARQVIRWVYKRGACDWSQMTDLPQRLREELAAAMSISPLVETVKRTARDGSSKLAFRLPDGASIETVIMPYRARATACISSQVGCAYNCAFCATGGLGLERNLTAAEIVGQVLDARASTSLPVTNVVFMGMGEALANYDSIMKAIRIINHPQCLGIGARHIAISTCGVPEQMRRLAGESLALHLAVSLNAPDDALRTRLMPVNRRYPLHDVVAAAREYAQRTGRKVSFEYCLLAGVNDSPAQAGATADLLRGMPCMMNLILYNQARGGFRRPGAAAVQAFRRRLQERGIEVAVRRSFGEEVAAACGQLAGAGGGSTAG
jgi:23S rRNA (adenine2503-C2)-methyltransferase